MDAAVILDIYIYPVGKLFDVDEVAAYLEVQPCTARDAVDNTTFMIGWSAEAVEKAIEARKRDPKRFETDMILVRVFAERIGIHHWTVYVEQARQFAEWLQARYEVRYQDEEFNDLSEHCTENLDFLFGTERALPAGRSLTMDAHGNFTVGDDPQGAIAVALLVATTTVNKALAALADDGGEGLRVQGVGSICRVTERAELPPPFDEDPKIDPDADELWALFREPDGTYSYPGRAVITGFELRDLVRRAMAARASAERKKNR